MRTVTMKGSHMCRFLLVGLVCILIIILYVFNPALIKSEDDLILREQVKLLSQGKSSKSRSDTVRTLMGYPRPQSKGIIGQTSKGSNRPNLGIGQKHRRRFSDRRIYSKERSHLEFSLDGSLFNQNGSYDHVACQVVTCLIHSFSPYVEREAARRFIDPPRENVYFANSPAITWFKDELVLVARIWLDREKYEPKEDWPSNHFADNWLYTQKFDRRMRPINNGSIMGVALPKQWWVGDGPIEPRLVVVGGNLFVTFNAAMALRQKDYIDYTIMWDYEANVPIVPAIKGGSPMVNATEANEMPRDKHWMALVDQGKLYFVHNLDPLRVLKCDHISTAATSASCEFVHNDRSSRQGLIFTDTFSHLRGGTPFELYSFPYYLSVAHCTMYKSSNHHRYYTTHIVVIRVRPYRVVYVSDDVRVHEDIFNETPMVRPKYIDDGFIFPVGLILEDGDTMDLGVHVNDRTSVVIRLRGLKGIMDRVMEIDRRMEMETNSTRGPPPGYVHEHIHRTLETTKGMKFEHHF